MYKIGHHKNIIYSYLFLVGIRMKYYNNKNIFVDKASYLREINIFKHKDYKSEKIKLIITWNNKFPIKDATKIVYSPIWLSGKKAEKIILNSNSSIFIGLYKNNFYFSVPIKNHLFPENSYFDLRYLNPLLKNEDLSLLTSSQGLSYWHNKNKYCGLCGTKTIMTDYGHARSCQKKSCNFKNFPRIDPAVIMLITYKDSCLLGRQHIWPKGMHSTLAGFVEHGETIEQAVERETYEETGVIIKNIQYKYSQPWPFPSSLMLGFHAEAKKKKLLINYSELETADWFSKKFLRSSPENDTFKLPGKISIARKLITDWLKN